MDDEPKPEEDLRQALVRNERLKARATYLNGIAVAVLAIGGLAPVATAAAAASAPSTAALLVGSVCLAMSFALHSSAMWVLGQLRP